MVQDESTLYLVQEVHNFGGFFGGDTVTLTATRRGGPEEQQTLTIDEPALRQRKFFGANGLSLCGGAFPAWFSTRSRARPELYFLESPHRWFASSSSSSRSQQLLRPRSARSSAGERALAPRRTPLAPSLARC